MGVGVGDPDKAFSRDAALIALAQARDQIGLPVDRLRVDRSIGPDSDRGPRPTGAVEASQSVLETSPLEPPKEAARGGLSLWGLLGLSTLVPIGVVVLGWHFLYRQAEVTPVSTSSASMDLATKSVPPSPMPSLVAEQKDTGAASLGSPRIDLNQSVATMAHQVADSRQEIEELKIRQAQILEEKSELDRRLKEAQELARSNADLIKDLKSAQAQMAQGHADLAAQVKASDEQVTRLAAQLDASQAQLAKIAAQIKVGQDQNARLVEQKQRPKLAIPAPLRTSSPPKKPAPKPRLQQAKPQTETPADTQ